MPAPTPVEAAFLSPAAFASVPKCTSAFAFTSRLPPVRVMSVVRVSLFFLSMTCLKILALVLEAETFTLTAPPMPMLPSE